MEIIVGKLGGFCAGVRNSVNKASMLLENKDKVYCLGELVHNERVIKDLEDKGLIIVDSLDDVPNNSIVIFRAHGEGINSYKLAKEKNIEIVDLTCPKVKLIHEKIKNNNDKYIVVIGKKSHPETIGHISYANDGIVIESISDIDNIKNNNKEIYIVVQTTFKEELFEEIVSNIKNNKVIIDNTICNATHDRQEEVRNIASLVDMMIIVGGKNSSNTKELSNIASDYCNTVLVQDKNDLNDIELNYNKIGIMGGASTPKIVIDEIYEYIKEYNRK